MKSIEAKERKYVENKLVKKLKELGIFNCKGNPQQLRGFPDRMIFINSNIIFVECKAGKELGSYYNQTPLQKKWQEQVMSSGAYYKLVVGSKGVDDFMAWLKGLIAIYGKTNCFADTKVV